jgi:hypothetical protein
MIQSLPEHIKLHILSYSYSPQPKCLLLDIKNYFATHVIIHNYYYEMHKWELNAEENANLNWLINDLLGYSNNNRPLNAGYVDFFYTIMQRHFMLQNKSNERIDNVLSNLHNKMVTSKINILWGLYTPHERIRFITHMYNK